ncbi:MAG: class I SAM-dependent methyltransferase [Spirochaetales bacterium]|nr:class I SAM-dependent methyltransferase [Spirochaetales bacterium]
MKIKQKQDDWNNQYQSKKWDYLKELYELPRYGILCSYMKYFNRKIKLLDVGCGEGKILEFCRHDLIDRYYGVDISRVALDKIEAVTPHDKFICSTIEEFVTDEKFDIILFNEILYYTINPENNLKRYKDFLAEKGLFIISMHKKSDPFAYNNRCIRGVWKTMKTLGWNIIDEVTLYNTSRKLQWKICLVEPKPQSSLQ